MLGFKVVFKKLLSLFLCSGQYFVVILSCGFHAKCIQNQNGRISLFIYFSNLIRLSPGVVWKPILIP